MSRRIEKINKHIQRTLGTIIQAQVVLPADVLVTVSRVDTTPNLKSAAVWLYIQPLERAPVILAQLKEQLYYLQGALNRELATRPLPRIRLYIDEGSEYAQHIEEKLAEIKRDQPPAAQP